MALYCCFGFERRLLILLVCVKAFKKASVYKVDLLFPFVLLSTIGFFLGGKRYFTNEDSLGRDVAIFLSQKWYLMHLF